MATTNIELDIENITGVADANDNFIISAQKFVVSSIPKDLLRWAGKETVIATHGGDDSPTDITIPVGTDNILFVQRNGYDVTEAPISDRAFLGASSTSLKKPTLTYPKYYIKDSNKVVVMPITTASQTATVTYVDFAKIDDTSDLLNAVVFHATSSEFSKLGSTELPSISISSTPPTSPTGSISSSGVSTVSISSLPSAPTYTTPTQTISSIAWATEYPTAEVDIATALGSIVTNVDLANSVLDSSPTVPNTPTLVAVDYASINDTGRDATSSAIDTVVLAAASIYTGADPSYSAPTARVAVVAFSAYVSGLSETDPGVFSSTSVPPDATTVPNFTFSIGRTIPTYTSPTVGGATESLTTTMDSDSAGYATDADFLNFSKWFSVAGEFIEDEEDSELAAVQLQKISTYISSYSQAMQDKLNAFNTGLQEFQAEVQADLQEAQYEQQAEYQAQLQKYQAEVGVYSADVNREVQEYQQKLAHYNNELNMSFQAWSKTETDKVSIYQVDTANELNIYNNEVLLYQSAIQESMQEIQVANQVKLAKAQHDVQVDVGNQDREQQRHLQNAVNEMQAIINNNNNLIQKYQADVTAFTSETQLMTAKSQGYLNTAQGYSAEIQSKMQVTQVKIQEYSSKIQDSLHTFNGENVVYQATIQYNIQQSQINMQEAQKEADLTLQAAIQNYTLALQKYSVEVQAYTSKVQAEVQAYQNKIQKQQAYAVESDKYYKWAQSEVNSYVQNNSKMIAATMASRGDQKG